MKNLEKLSKIHQKSEEMVPRSVPKAISELGQQKGGHIKRKISSFLLIMLIFGHFWGPLKNRGGAKNDPKNSIRRLLGTPGRPKGEKKRFWMTLKKRYYFDWFLYGFFMDFRSNLDYLFNDFCIIFCHDFWIDFWYFSKRRFFVFQCAVFVKIIVFPKEKRRFYNFT